MPIGWTRSDYAKVMANDVKSLSSPTLSEAMHSYLQLKGVGKAKNFHQAAIRNVGVVFDFIGDKPIADYRTIEGVSDVYCWAVTQMGIIGINKM